jgi:thiol:disulfide interchange protein
MSDDPKNGGSKPVDVAPKAATPRKSRAPRKTKAAATPKAVKSKETAATPEQKPAATRKRTTAKSKTTTAQKPAAAKPAAKRAPARKTTATKAKTPTQARTTSKTASTPAPRKAKAASKPAAAKAAPKPQTTVQATPKAAQPDNASAPYPGAQKPDYGPLDASEIVFFGFGILLYSLLGMTSFIALMVLQFVRTVFLRGSDSLSGLCAQLQAYLSQIFAYAADPDADMPFPFSPLPSSHAGSTEK